jgi:hypothetical protein
VGAKEVEVPPALNIGLYEVVDVPNVVEVGPPKGRNYVVLVGKKELVVPPVVVEPVFQVGLIWLLDYPQDVVLLEVCPHEVVAPDVKGLN